MKQKARVVLSYEVSRIIEWFTHNFDKEIGAVGAGKIRRLKGEKYFYIDELFFPKQKVTGTTVSIENKMGKNMWGELIKDKHFMERMGDICFYWHRHPSSATHSSVDEEDTFETFMAPEAERNHFIFLQTASQQNGQVTDMEARIDIRNPIRVTIQDKDIEVFYEPSPEEIALAEKCEKIKETCIVKDEPKAWGKDGYKEHWKEQDKKESTLENKVETLPFFTNFDMSYMDNDTLQGHKISLADQVSVSFKDGQVTIKAGQSFGDLLEKALEAPKLKDVVKVTKRTFMTMTGKTQYNIQPKGKCYYDLKTIIKKIFVVYNEHLLRKIERNMIKDEKIEEEEGEEKSNQTRFLQIKDKAVSSSILSGLESISEVKWGKSNDDKHLAEVFDSESKNLIGTIEKESCGYTNFYGVDLVDVIEDIQHLTSLESINGGAC